MELLPFLAKESELIQLEIAVLLLLTIAAGVALIMRRIRFPYTVALVLVGATLSLVPNFLPIDVSSDVILAILVPPLLFEATLHITWKNMRKDLVIILILAIGGTLIGTLIVGEIVTWVLDVPLLAALAFGALISATDPVAVIAFFRSLGVSKRLSFLVEGESLFNDGAAIVVFNLMVSLAIAGPETFNLGAAIIEFLRVSLGGLAVGLILGYIVSYIILKNLDDHLLETTTTVALTFGAYIIAEQFHFSGILSVVAAGLMVGNIGMQNTSPTTRLTLENFWEFSSFVVNSMIFLLIGFELEIDQFTPYLFPIVVAVVAVLLSRAIIIYLITSIHDFITPRPRDIPNGYRHVMYWGGLRGAISLALALTLTGDVFGQAFADEMRIMTFGVVLFTLLVQGTTIESLIKRLKLAEEPQQRLKQQELQANIYAKRAGKQELDRLHDDDILFPEIWEAMGDIYEEEIAKAKKALNIHLHNYPELEQEVFLQAREDVLKAERAAISKATHEGFLSDELHHKMLKEMDNHLAALEIIKENRGLDEDEE
ncbi:MAG: Na+/H+ antiporter [Chloroflexi bacterium]|nr:MAG: Na+/H+ antiporter [Chloroflexota bacterium]